MERLPDDLPEQYRTARTYERIAWLWLTLIAFGLGIAVGLALPWTLALGAFVAVCIGLGAMFHVGLWRIVEEAKRG